MVFLFLMLVHLQLVTSSQDLSGEAPIVGNKMSHTALIEFSQLHRSLGFDHSPVGGKLEISSQNSFTAPQQMGHASG